MMDFNLFISEFVKFVQVPAVLSGCNGSFFVFAPETWLEDFSVLGCPGSFDPFKSGAPRRDGINIPSFASFFFL